MTSSTSSSSRAAAALAALVLCGAARSAEPPAAAPDAPAPRTGLATRIALLPLTSLAGRAAPLRELQSSLEALLRARGLELATGGAVDEFLARHRLRYTAGVDEVMARAARDDLGVDALLVGAVTQRSVEGSAAAFGLSLRLVSSGESLELLWADADSGTTDQSPGLFGLGVLTPQQLLDRTLVRLADSLSAALSGKGPAFGTCPASGRFAPRVRFRGAPGPVGSRLTVAVVPFVNETARLDAGELLALDFVRELARQPGLRVLEPGLVRAELLRNRVVMEGGVSHETARVALGALQADVVVAGYVRGMVEAPVPRLEFTVLALATWDNRVVWESTSYASGDDRVILFDWGLVSAAPDLSCRMVRPVAEGMAAVWHVPAATRSGSR